MKIFQLKCPYCGNYQQYSPLDGNPTEKTKVCVYCGKRFIVHKHLGKTAIIKELNLSKY